MSTATTQEASCFQLKADFFPMTVLKLKDFSAQQIRDQLNSIAATAPNYFQNSPMVIDVTHWATEWSELDLTALCNTLKELQIIPVGIRGLPKKHHQLAYDNHIAIVSNSKQKPNEKAEQPKQEQQTSKKSAATNKTKIIQTPIRSGSKVYAEGGDLIILSSVNAGAEIIADGNIHVYGTLRGRALAGAKGDTNARIFCRKLEADLISIAGVYKTSEFIKAPRKQALLQIYLENSEKPNLKIQLID